MKTTSTINQRLIFISLLWLIAFIYTPVALAQNVTILPSGITPNQSGGVSRLSNDAIMALPNPQDGDMVYDVTFSCFRFYRKNKWVKMLNEFDIPNPSMIGWQMGGTRYDQATAVATDASGNVYVAGYFQESALFENTEVTGNGTSDDNLFIAKYTSTGHVVWVQRIGYSNAGSIEDLLLDANGNIYVTGFFYGSATFGANTIASAGVRDVFLAKCNNSGTLQWIRQAGGAEDDEARSLCLDSNGNIYITGIINGNVVFGGNTYIGSGYHVFMAKYTNDGTFQWMRRGGGGNDNRATGIAADANGKITMIGYFTGTTMFGGSTITCAGLFDVFLVQYDTSGTLVWATSMGGSGVDLGIDVAVNSNNNLIIFGSFEGAASFGGYGLYSAGLEDVFIAQVHSTGFVQWIKREGGVNHEEGRSLALDTNGNIYITGDFNKLSTFGNTVLYGYEETNVYMAKYNADGRFQWAKELKSNKPKTIVKIAADTSGNVYGAGYFTYEFVTDDTIFTSRGASDGFVLRFRD